MNAADQSLGQRCPVGLLLEDEGARELGLELLEVVEALQIRDRDQVCKDKTEFWRDVLLKESSRTSTGA